MFSLHQGLARIHAILLVSTSLLLIWILYPPNLNQILLDFILGSQIRRGTVLSTHSATDTPSSSFHHTEPSFDTNGSQRHINPHLGPLLRCSLQPNPHTGHIRLPAAHYNISLIAPNENLDTSKRYFNPTIIPLPYWSKEAKYILVSRVVTEGLHQESIICLADFCSPPNHQHSLIPGTKPCLPFYHTLLDPRGGLHCTKPPLRVGIPPTPAKQCSEAWAAFPDIPGFHDPRIFWSGKGEPLIMVNSASMYGCVGLWVVDLRVVFPELKKIMNRNGKEVGDNEGPMMSYPRLTEITRNPRSSRHEVEKNWIMWFPNRFEAWIQYDIVRSIADVGDGSLNKAYAAHLQQSRDHDEAFSDGNADSSVRSSVPEHGVGGEGGRSFALLIGNGLTTTNLADRDEPLCLDPRFNSRDEFNKTGHFHQSTPALRLVLCTRAQMRSGICSGDLVAQGKSVHFAIIHRKFSNELDLPMRYERFVIVWESRRPFRMLAFGRWPVLMQEERANPWSERENWPSEEGEGWNSTTLKARNQQEEISKSQIERQDAERRASSYFTYTPSLAWAWTPKNLQIYDSNHVHKPLDDNEDGSLGDNEDETIESLSSLGTGYLGDEVVLGIGLDDLGQVVSRVMVDDLLQCLRLCPGVSLS